MTNIHAIARELQTTPSHVAYAHREQQPIRGHVIVREGKDYQALAELAADEVSEGLCEPTEDMPEKPARNATDGELVSVVVDLTRSVPAEAHTDGAIATPEASAALAGPTAAFTAARVIESMPFDEYIAIDAANATSLKRARKSIAHMLAPAKGSAAFDLGRQVHTLILEGRTTYREHTAIRPSRWADYRSKDSRAWRDEQQAAGLTVLTADEAELVAHVAKQVAAHPAASALLAAAPRTARELTMLWTDVEYAVPCKCRFDAIAWPEDEAAIAIDLKTTQSAHPNDFGRSVVNFGYDLQAAHYSAGYLATMGRPLGAYVLIAVETAAPFGVAVYQIGPEVLERGASERDLALDDWAAWWLAGKPDVRPYPDHITPLQLPGWA